MNNCNNISLNIILINETLFYNSFDIIKKETIFQKELHMLKNNIISPLLEMTPQGVGKWKKENRPIIKLLEKYFTKEDIEIFLEEGFIPRFEIMEDYEKYDDKITENLENSINILNLDFDTFNKYMDWHDAKIIAQIYFDIDTNSFFTSEDPDYKEKFQNEYSIREISINDYLLELDSSYKEYFMGAVYSLSKLDEKAQSFFIKSRLLQMKFKYVNFGTEIEQEYKNEFTDNLKN